MNKLFDGKTVARTFICNATHCDHNDFGKCLGKPWIVNMDTHYTCIAFDDKEMLEAEAEINEQRIYDDRKLPPVWPSHSLL